jgi:glucose-6-phosphate-specific signal transduction histidine kinase
MKNLNNLAGRLANNLLPLAVRNHSFFVNTIPSDLPAQNEEWLTNVINGLLTAIVCNARDTCIRLSAKKIGEAIVLEIKEAGCISTYSLACGLQEVQSLAEKIGGSLNISMHRQKATTIAFKFPMSSSAA